MGLTEPFTQNSFRSPRSPCRIRPPCRTNGRLQAVRSHNQATNSTLLIFGESRWYQRRFGWGWDHWQRSYSCVRGSSSKDLLSRKSSVRWGSWGMECSCDPSREGVTPFPPPGPVGWPVWLVPLLKDGLQLWEDTAGLRARLAYTAFLLITCTRSWRTNVIKHSGYSLNSHGPWGPVNIILYYLVFSVCMRLPLSAAFKSQQKTMDA